MSKLNQAVDMILWFAFCGSLLFGYLKSRDAKAQAAERTFECHHGMHGLCMDSDCACRCHEKIVA